MLLKRKKVAQASLVVHLHPRHPQHLGSQEVNQNRMMAKQHHQAQKIQQVIPLVVIKRNRAQIALAVNHQIQPLTREIQLNQTALRALIAQQILQVNQTAHHKQMKQQKKTQVQLVMTKQQRIYRQTIVIPKMIHLQIKLKVISSNQKKNQRQINRQKKKKS